MIIKRWHKLAILILSLIFVFSLTVFNSYKDDDQSETSTYQGEHYPSYIPEGLKDLSTEPTKVNPVVKLLQSFREQPASKSRKVTVFGVDEYDPGPDGKTVWYQIASPIDDSIFEGRGWWLPEKKWEQITIQDRPAKISTQFEEFEYEDKQYNHAWTWIELEKDDSTIRFLGINVDPDEVIMMAKSIE